MECEERLSVRVRPVRAEEEARCAEIFLIGRRDTHHWQPEDRFRVEDYREIAAAAETLVAEVDSGVVGFVALDRWEHFIHALFVDPDWQHRGVGTALLRAAVARLHGRAALKCSIRNQQARAFYERRGWVPQAEDRRAHDPHVLYRTISAMS